MANNSPAKTIADGASIFFLLKPFKMLLTWLTIFFSFFGIGIASLMFFLSKFKMLELLYEYQSTEISYSGWDRVLAKWIYNGLFWLSFELTQIQSTLANVPASSSGGKLGYRNVLIKYSEQIELYNIGLQIISIRMGVILTYTVSVIILLLILATFDGWMERKIRTACLGRESSTMYHQAKFWRSGLTILSILFMLAWPGFIEPAGLFITSTLLVFLTFIQAKYYKKFI